ncbi:small COPII coat GTPase SAR1 [Ustulina deusta]|nr:small COPII coat GTPase SAR1 [Ustulina deusta]KAI3330094.1 small COPII coat GTPase SAR1 [Ustulina deusta]
MKILDRVSSFMGIFLGLFNKQTKILILGLNKAGKSTLLMQIASHRPGVLKPTLHPISEELVIQNVKFAAIKFGGDQQGRRLWSDHLHNISAIIFVVDVADHERFVEVKAELDALLATKETHTIPIVVLGNKIDHLYAVSEEELRYELGLDRILGRPIELCMCSLDFRQGYGKAFQWLADHVKFGKWRWRSSLEFSQKDTTEIYI